MNDTSLALNGLMCIIVLTGFVRIFVSLNILRHGIGFQGAGFGVVIALFSLCLALMDSPLGNHFYAWNFSQQVSTEMLNEVKPIIEQGGNPEIKAALRNAAFKASSEPQVAHTEKQEFNLAIAAYLLTQLKEACALGLMLLIPFIVIDIIVTHCLVILGVTQISALIISFPLKLALFTAVDGWKLVAEKLLAGGV